MNNKAQITNPMQINRLTLLFIISFIVLSATYKSDLFSDHPLIQKITTQLDKKKEHYAPEKVYLQLNQPFVKPNEILWFSAYVRDANTLQPSKKSEIVYIEILDPNKSVIQKLSLLTKNGQAAGDIKISKYRKGGIYKIRAYTNWQKNREEYFEKSFEVQTTVLPNLLMKLDFERKAYSAGEEGQAVLNLKDLANRPLKNKKITYIIQLNGENIAEFEAETDNKGKAKINFQLPDALETADGLLNVMIKHNGQTESIARSIPIALSMIDLKFLPEGGDLLGGFDQRVAFKAVDIFGKPADVSGIIHDSQGQEVAQFRSYHQGMGAFNFIPKTGETYTAVITQPLNIHPTHQNQKLPVALAEGFNISNIYEKDKKHLVVPVHASHAAELFLVVRSSGKVHFSKKIKVTKGTQNILVPIEQFPIGIAQFTLFDGNEQPHAERLVFVNPHKRLKIDIKTNKKKYLPREKVMMDITVKNEKGKPVKGNFSLAVADDKLLSFADDRQSNILSYVFLESELKGKIEEPNWYFEEKPDDFGKERLKALDHLMMTQGWRRFTWKEILNEPLAKMEFKGERKIISGTVFDRYERPLPNAEVAILGTEIKHLTDEKGRFTIEEYDLKTGRNLQIKAEGYLPTKHPLKKYEEDLKFPLRLPLGSIKGSMHISDPLLRGNIVLYGADGSRRTTSQYSGRNFFFSNLKPGRYILLGSCRKGTTPVVIDNIVVEPNDTFFTSVKIQANTRHVYDTKTPVLVHDTLRVTYNTLKKWHPVTIKLPSIYIEENGERLLQHKEFEKTFNLPSKEEKIITHYANVVTREKLPYPPVEEEDLDIQIDLGDADDIEPEPEPEPVPEPEPTIEEVFIAESRRRNIPPPPPPPPPIIEEVPNETIEEDIEFEDLSVEEEEIEEAEAVPDMDLDIEPIPEPEPEPEPEIEEVFTIVEQMPRFPGCGDMAGTDQEKRRCSEEKLMEFIYSNVKYPTIAREAGIEGMVVIRFVVGKDGSILEPKILRDIGGNCGREALRVVKLMNQMPLRWTPGRQRNRPVNVIFNLPVRFKLDGVYTPRRRTQTQQYAVFQSIYYDNREFYAPKYETAATQNPKERTDFRSTLYWNPSIETDENGKASVSFYTSDEITSFRTTIEGFGAKGQVGRTENVFFAQLPLGMSIKVPKEILTGDVVRFPLTLANNTNRVINGKLQIRVPSFLKSLNVNQQSVITYQLLANETKTVFLPYKVQDTTAYGKLSVLYEGEGLRDAFSTNIQAISKGFPVDKVFSGKALSETFEVTIKKAIPHSIHASIRIYPDILYEVMDGIDRMIRQPYGCFEQTSSVNYPNVMALNYLKETNTTNPAIEEKANKHLEFGYNRLKGFEVSETNDNQTVKGGFDWYGRPPAHVGLTAYGLMQFVDMKKVYPVEQDLIDRTVRWLLMKRDGKGGWKRKGRYKFGNSHPIIGDAYAVWALTEAGYADRIGKEIEAAYTNAMHTKDPYLLALMANTLFNTQDKRANEVITELLLHQEKEGSWMGKSTSITNSRFDNLRIETTALAVLGLLKSSASNRAIKGIQFLLKSRNHYGFGSTQGTILTLKALTTYSKESRAKSEGGIVNVYLNGQKVKSKAYTKEQNKPIEMNGIGHFLKEGKQEITISYEGTNAALPYVLELSYNTFLPKNPKDCPVTFDTKILKSTINQGETVRITTTLKNATKEAVSNPIALLGVPAGLSPQPWQLKKLQEEDLFDYYEIWKGYVVFYFRGLEAKQTKTIHLDFKADIPGEFEAPTSSAYLYYDNRKKFWAMPERIVID